MIEMSIFSASYNVELACIPVEADRICPGSNPERFYNFEIIAAQDLRQPFSAIGNQYPVHLRHIKEAMRRFKPSDVLNPFAALHIEDLDRSMVLSRQKQPPFVQVNGEMVEITGVVRQIN